MTTARRQLDLAMSEAQWQQTVTELAAILEWDWYHTHDSRRSPAGFPDLVMVRERVIFAELKAERGRLTEPQYEWIVRLTHADAEVYVWRPSDWTEVERTLARREGRAG